MSNCLFEAAYERVLRECECLPSFHAPIEAVKAGYNDTCKGPSLACMKRILGLLGKLNTVRQPGGFFGSSLCQRKWIMTLIIYPTLFTSFWILVTSFVKFVFTNRLPLTYSNNKGAMAPKPSVLRFLFVCCISNFVIST